jgi:predicted nucleic acid-binding protein
MGCDDGRKSMVKLPDAIHVVTANSSGCRRILSNDTRLRLPVGYQRVVLDSASVFALVQELQ